MIRRPRYYFDKTQKKEFVRGQTLVYLCEKIGISYSYLSSIIQGKNVVDDYFIRDIMLGIGYSDKEIKTLKNKYFIEKKSEV